MLAAQATQDGVGLAEWILKQDHGEALRVKHNQAIQNKEKLSVKSILIGDDSICGRLQ